MKSVEDIPKDTRTVITPNESQIGGEKEKVSKSIKEAVE